MRKLGLGRQGRDAIVSPDLNPGVAQRATATDPHKTLSADYCPLGLSEGEADSDGVGEGDSSDAFFSAEGDGDAFVVVFLVAVELEVEPLVPVFFAVLDVVVFFVVAAVECVVVVAVSSL